MPDSLLDPRSLELGPPGQELLFGTAADPPRWLWLALDIGDLPALEAALLAHLRSPLFPTRLGEGPSGCGDDAGLLEFARRFAGIAGRFAGGPELVIAATRLVAERGGPLARQGALACVDALQHRLHAEARCLGEAGAAPERLRRFVLAARLAADLWMRFVPQPDGGRSLPGRLGDALGLAGQAAPAPPPPAAAAPADQPSVTVLGGFDPPNERAEWEAYRPLANPLPLRQLRRDAAARLGALAEANPAFAAPVAELRRTLALAAHAGRPSPRVRPLLLLGPPGVGKTWFARRLAEALDLPFASLNLGGATDNRCLQGTARGWGAATPAWPVAEMARLRAPNPVLFLDEVDKAGGARDANGRAHDTLLAMIEPESAAAWFDECLRVPADLRHAIWIMAANDLRGVPAVLLSRLSVHRIGPPAAHAFAGVLAGLLQGIAADVGCDPGDLPPLAPEVTQALARRFARDRNLRLLRAALEECLGIAAEAARHRAH